MMTTIKKYLKLVVLLGITLGFIASCASKTEVVYFQDAQNYETIISDNTANNKFKINDIIGINISTLNAEASVPFNIFTGSQEGGMRPQQMDYIVDKNGEIDFPVIGNIKIADLSPQETKELLREKLKPYLINPIINMRLKNFRVTVLGEVNNPGTYQVNGEQITVLEAIGLASDLTIKGMRENVLIIRDFNGAKVYHRINLTSKDVLSSPNYYLTQNDVVYVEPNKSAITSSSLDNRATIAISIASILLTSTVILITRN
ncbi:polysaccharide biosynthesis/export family protein [Maribacter antarcticus]|uniref:polysaccharide biosynthesis/export family protein n=1 Tax=Maribacter antarcticus TaxID=505250 RepID=UPI000478A460|nr:polysaccharide biosynthesis/export family protein [Maribacter antarcticus]